MYFLCRGINCIQKKIVNTSYQCCCGGFEKQEKWLKWEDSVQGLRAASAGGGPAAPGPAGGGRVCLPPPVHSHQLLQTQDHAAQARRLSHAHRLHLSRYLGRALITWQQDTLPGPVQPSNSFWPVPAGWSSWTLFKGTVRRKLMWVNSGTNR